MKNIALLCGFETADQAEEHRKRSKTLIAMRWQHCTTKMPQNKWDRL